jgi:hypothetical protein
VSAELYVTNTMGNSPTSAICLTQTTDFGLRTLAGGQFSFQVEGFLAIETGATPDLIVEQTHSVRDVYAVIRQAPAGGSVQLQINQGGAAYCSLTIADGANFELGRRRITSTINRGSTAVAGYHDGWPDQSGRGFDRDYSLVTRKIFNAEMG